MTLKWKLTLALVGVVLATTLAEAVASKWVNLQIASFGAQTWLKRSHAHTGKEIIESLYERLEDGARILALSKEREGREAFERDGWFWIETADGGATTSSPSAAACAQLAPPLPRSKREPVMCDGEPALTVTAATTHGALRLGRKLDQHFVERIAAISLTETALFNSERAVASSARDEAGKLVPVEFDSGSGRLAATDQQQRWIMDGLSAPGYRGYIGGDSGIVVGKHDYQSTFALSGPLPGAEELPVALMLWIPTEVMTGDGWYSFLIHVGTLVVLPLLIIGAWIIASRFARPIMVLANAAQRVSDGDLTVSVPRNLTGEVGVLARAFDLMVENLRQAQERGVITEKMAAVGQLAGGVAHEINNPLGVILGFAQGMERRIPEGDALRMPVTSIVREALRCKALVQELLVFSRKGTSTQEPIDLNELTRATATLLDSRAKTQRVDLVCELSKDVLAVKGNRTQLQQVIVNLGTNALDAMESGGVLTLHTRVENGNALLIVADTGVGIDESLRTRIFDPFFTTKQVGRGTGLGLSLVHEIVKQHQGKIEFDSVLGVGTAMRVTLPTGART